MIVAAPSEGGSPCCIVARSKAYGFNIVTDSSTKPKDEVSPPNASEARSKLGEQVDATIGEVVASIWRLAATILIFLVRPRYAAQRLSEPRPEYQLLLRPHTFLLIGCFCCSLFVRALELSRGSADGTVRGLRWNETTEAIAVTFQTVITDAFSLLGVIIQTLPILFVTSLAAYGGSLVLRSQEETSRRFFRYLYGLQGAVLIVVYAGLESVGEASAALLGSDDFSALFPVLVVIGLAVQAARCLAALLEVPAASRSWKRVGRYVVFLLLFAVPLPTAGFGAYWMKASVDQISEEHRHWGPGPPIRIVDVRPLVVDGSRLRFSLSALVENRSTKTIALRPRDVTVEVSFVSPQERERSIQFSRGLPSNVRSDVDSFDRYTVVLDDAVIGEADERSGLWTLVPGAEELVTILVDQDVTSARFHPNERGRYRFGSDDEWRAEWSRRLNQGRAELKDVAEGHLLGHIARGNTAFIRLELTDAAATQKLLSGYYSVSGRVGAPTTGERTPSVIPRRRAGRESRPAAPRGMP